MNDHPTYIAEHGARAGTFYAACGCGWSGPARRNLDTARGEALAHAQGLALTSYVRHADGTVTYRYGKATSAQRDENRLSDDDRANIRAALGAEMTRLRWSDGRTGAYAPSIADDFNRAQRVAHAAIGCTGLDLRQSEVDEIADMVAAAILDAGALAVAR